ncbi:MAG: hypothetical protein EA422_09725 [Gemmatimonadales bacterium]|nr:MAG: hypothetical protein EA422_09725 [Gemmatimonadales bacterium]
MTVKTSPRAFSIKIRSSRRPEVTDLRAELEAREDVPELSRFARLLCVSYHTTAGFMDPPLRRRLAGEPDRVQRFLDALAGIFPPHAGYHHDRLELRDELSEEQKVREPLNADAHLSFIGGGFTNCAVYRSDSVEPLWFVDFDGAYTDSLNEPVRRVRHATVVGYESEEVVDSIELEVDAAREHRAVRLRQDDACLTRRLTEIVRSHGIRYGRVDLSLASAEKDSGITVNEFEALLMERDLKEILDEPLRYALDESQLQRAMGALGVSPERHDPLLARALQATPARLLRVRREVSLAVLPGGDGGQVVQGTYQSPILLQWGRNGTGVRRLRADIVRLH